MNNEFWTYENSDSPVTYLFNKNHILVLLVSLVLIIFFSMYVTRQKLKFQKRFVAISIFFLILFEGLRILFRYYYLSYNNQDFSFFNIVNFDFFTISLWTSIPLLILGCALKKEYKNNTFGLSFVFFVTNLAAVISLIYPIGINENFEFYHFYNLMFIFLRAIIIMLSLIFVVSKWISVSNFLDLWKGVLSLIVLGLICCSIGFLANSQANLFYIDYCPLFDSLGIYLTFPLHYIMLGIFLFVLQIIFVTPFAIANAINQRKNK